MWAFKGLVRYATLLRNSVLFEVFEGDEFEGCDVGGFKDDFGGAAGFEGFFPAAGAEAPTVAGFEARELVFGTGGDEVISHFSGKFKKFFCHDCADGMDAVIAGTDAAVTVAEEASKGVKAAGLEGAAEDVGWAFSGVWRHGWFWFLVNENCLKSSEIWDFCAKFWKGFS